MGMQQAERGIALLRIVLGLWILRWAMSHLIWNPWPWASASWVQVITTQLAQHSLDHPSFWVRYFIQQALLPNADLYVGVTVVLQSLAGISLTFGIITVLGALLALLLSLAAGVLTYYAGSSPLDYHLLQGTMAVVFIVTRAGRRWGFDTFFAGIRSRALFW